MKGSLRHERKVDVSFEAFTAVKIPVKVLLSCDAV
jgi:hypothetical protein